MSNNAKYRPKEREAEELDSGTKFYKMNMYMTQASRSHPSKPTDNRFRDTHDDFNTDDKPKIAQ